MLAYVAAMYSAPVLDKATTFCSLDCYDTILPAKVDKYPDVDFLLSLSPTKSESGYPFRIGFAPQNIDNT